MDTKEVAEKLFALCQEGKNLDAINTLYSENIVSVEAVGDEQMPAIMKGIEAIRGKNQWWFENHEIHSAEVRGPFPNEDRFALIFNFEISPKVGPAAGKIIKMEEVGLYTVEDGKITREEYYYAT